MKLIKKLNTYLNEYDYKIVFKNNCINIVNYDVIIDFTSKYIKVQINNKLYIIEGKNLLITKMVDNELLIKGDIFKILINSDIYS